MYWTPLHLIPSRQPLCFSLFCLVFCHHQAASQHLRKGIHKICITMIKAVFLAVLLVPLASAAGKRRLGPALKYGKLEQDLNGVAAGGEPELDCSELLRPSRLL